MAVPLRSKPSEVSNKSFSARGTPRRISGCCQAAASPRVARSAICPPLRFYEACEIVRIVIEAGKYWRQIADAVVPLQYFAEYAAKVGGQREIAAFV